MVKKLISAGCGMLLLLGLALPAFAQVSLVRDGHVQAVVVTAARPSEVATYAAQEFVDHVAKATGQKLPIVAEPNIPAGYPSHVFIGVTDAARKQGIDASKLKIEEFTLRTIGSDLYIVGNELNPDIQLPDEAMVKYYSRRNPLSTHNLYSGTMFGAYEVLERYVGVRWLWPGELGTYVPRAGSITIPALDETVKPRLLYRDIGGWNLAQIGLTGCLYGKKIKPSWKYAPINSEVLLRTLIFPNEDAGYAYGSAVEVYNRRHRRVTPIEQPLRVPRTAHTTAGVADWWASYGKEHPEWFAMRPDGGRGLKVPRPGPYTAKCVSNPELQKFIVNDVWNGHDILQMGEADVGGDGFCQCPVCLSWDAPQPKNYPEDVREYYSPHVVSDRYARFWKTEYDLAVKRDPDVRMPVYLYNNTLPAPTTDIKLNDHIQGEFVIYGGWAGWYPMSNAEDQWVRDQWLGWAKTGIRLFDRSNYLLNTYVTPNVATHQEGDFLKFACDHNMVGIDLESYTFSWAAQGPEAYLHYRLIENPDLKVDDIIQEYYSAFGPAAKDVEQYFDYWENYARTRPKLFDINTGDPGAALEKLRRTRGHYMAYPPEVFVPAAAILDKALVDAQKDPLPEFAQRVKFLQAGMKHALLTLRVYKYLDYESPTAGVGSAPTDPAKLKLAREAMRDVINFRRDPANMFVSDYMSNAMVEKNFIKNIETLFPAP